MGITDEIKNKKKTNKSHTQDHHLNVPVTAFQENGATSTTLVIITVPVTLELVAQRAAEVDVVT